MACFSAVQVKMFAVSHSDRVRCCRDPQRGVTFPFSLSHRISASISGTLFLGGWLGVGSMELKCTWEGAQDFLCKVLFSFPPSFEKY